ncbi:Hypothetical predicted protein, partial [Pelobates cultripes]
MGKSKGEPKEHHLEIGKAHHCQNCKQQGPGHGPARVRGPRAPPPPSHRQRDHHILSDIQNSGQFKPKTDRHGHVDSPGWRHDRNREKE